MNANRGFTLIELLIALLIFAIMSTIVTVALRSVITARDYTISANKRLEEIQACLTRLDTDIQQMARYIRHDAAGVPESVVTWNNGVITFTRGGYTNPNSLLPRSNLAMIRYELKNSKLLRYTDTIPYTTPNSDPQLVLDGVTAWQWQFYDAQKKVFTNWPPVQALSIVEPAALELVIQTRDFGQIERFWLTPEQQFEYSER